ncbi:MAG: ATP-binding protein [Rubrivivax sp.]
MAVFHRAQLAADIVSRLLQAPPTTASGSGLFLAAPRRTGKSTFLREDLRPALEARGALVIYVDLWEDRSADPGEVITSAVRSAISRREGVIKRLARGSGMEKITVGGLAFSLERVGLAKGVSLSAALAALSDETAQLIVLLVDEAQHAITSPAGSDALFALKAARDEINSSAHHGLRIVATGSNRDKLAMLRSSKEQAFFGAPLVSFPVLGLDYIEWLIQHLPFGSELEAPQVYRWFERAAHRPEILGAAVDALLFDLQVSNGGYSQRLQALVQEQIAASNQEALRVVRSLTPLQSAVLRVLAKAGDSYGPFEAQTIEQYKSVLQIIAPHATVEPDTANVQQALSALQEKALVWRATRGVYALEDSFLAELMRKEGMLG